MQINKDRVESIEDISRLLGIPVKSLVYFANHIDRHVKEHREPKSSGGTRLITAPDGDLKKLLRSLKDLVLLEYTYPAYVFGLGGNTLRDHGELHKGGVTTVKLDLTDFYPSLKKESVYRMWRETFEFTDEAARVLTKLTTLHGGLTQGFPTSSHIAAIVAGAFTSELNFYASNNGLKFSQYVDDLNLSGVSIDHRMLFKTAIDLARKSGLRIKKRKTKVTSPKDGKVITGVSVFENRTRATRSVRQRAIRALKDLENDPTDELNQRRARGYAGFLKHLHATDGKKYSALVSKHLPTKK